jgi:hypothetical protein
VPLRPLGEALVIEADILQDADVARRASGCGHARTWKAGLRSRRNARRR